MPALAFDNLNFVNCDQSGYIECHVAYWMWRITPILLVAFGTIGNILNVVVLCRKQLRKKSTCIYLLFLAASDTTVLISGPLDKFIRNVLRVDIYALSALSCSLSKWIQYTAVTISCWLIVLITVERTMVTLFPIKARLKTTPRNAIIASATVVMLAALQNGKFIFGHIIEETRVNMTVDNQTHQTSVKSCTSRPAWNAEFNNALRIMLTSTVSVIPFCLIVTGNAIVGISIIRRKRAFLGIQYSDQNNNNRRGKGFSTNIFFVLCAVFIVTTLPFGLFASLIGEKKEVNGHTFAKYQLVNIIIKSVSWCNFSFNFLLYFMTGTLFKTEFNNMLESLRKSFRH